MNKQIKKCMYVYASISVFIFICSVFLQNKVLPAHSDFLCISRPSLIRKVEDAQPDDFQNCHERTIYPTNLN